MLQAGDEAGRTQHGNNNAYCHDGPLSWFDWNLVHENADLLRFARFAIAFRQAHQVLRCGPHARSDQREGVLPAISWHGVQAWKPDWAPCGRLLAVMRYAVAGATHDCVYLAANSYWEGQSLELPALPEGLAWHLFADTAAQPPRDVYEPGHEPPLDDQTRVRIGPRSVLVLAGRPPKQRPPAGPDGTRGSEQQ
jgi:glycogen operon protein